MLMLGMSYQVTITLSSRSTCRVHPSWYLWSLYIWAHLFGGQTTCSTASCYREGVTICYSKNHKRTKRPYKAPEKKRPLRIRDIPLGKKAIGLRVRIEFFADEQRTSTTWFKGTVIAYSRKGYVVTFDGCGPEENETIKSLKQSQSKGEL